MRWRSSRAAARAAEGDGAGEHAPRTRCGDARQLRLDDLGVAAAAARVPASAPGQFRRQTARFKDSARPQGAQTLIGGFGLLPSALRAPVLRAVQPGRFNLTISSVPGPPTALFMHGMRLDELYPVIPIAPDQTLSIGMLPYEGHLYFGLYADPDGLPEATRLAVLIDAELRALGSSRGDAHAARPPLPVVAPVAAGPLGTYENRSAVLTAAGRGGVL